MRTPRRAAGSALGPELGPEALGRTGYVSCRKRSRGDVARRSAQTTRAGERRPNQEGAMDASSCTAAYLTQLDARPQRQGADRGGVSGDHRGGGGDCFGYHGDGHRPDDLRRHHGQDRRGHRRLEAASQAARRRAGLPHLHHGGGGPALSRVRVSSRSVRRRRIGTVPRRPPTRRRSRRRRTPGTSSRASG